VSLFRIVLEALQNAVKYSRAHTVDVHLHGEPEGLVLTVSDDGVGFDVDTAWGKGLGLINIGERIQAIGGTLDARRRHYSHGSGAGRACAGRRSGRGWAVRVGLPISSGG
jgi:signal transduction histidine kinase